MDVCTTQFIIRKPWHTFSYITGMKMRNKFMSRGFLMILVGIGLGALGYFLKNDTNYMYGWAMITGVIVFGIGFLTVMYSLIRKVEAQSIIEERAAEQEKNRKVHNPANMARV